MGKGKRNSAIFISSSDDEDFRLSASLNNHSKSGTKTKPKAKSVPARKNPKRAKRSSVSITRSRTLANINGFDEIRRFCDEFDEGFTWIKVSSGFGMKEGLWVDKYKPTSLEELAVHKKKVEEVKNWFQERLTSSGEHSHSNVLLICGPAGVGKSATVYAIASHLGARVWEWNAPVPTVWQEHLHNTNSGIRYVSKLDEFENFVERIRKYGLIPPSLNGGSLTPIIVLIDDLPLANGKVVYGRLQRCFHLLLQSVCFPTAILITDSGKSDSSDSNACHWEELVLSMQRAGAHKVMFNPVTVNSIRRRLLAICREEQFEVDSEQIDLIAKASEGDMRHAITSLQYFCLKPHPINLLYFSKSIPSYQEERMDGNDELDVGISLPFGRDTTLSLFHALGKFLHNKRESEITESDRGAILLKEKFSRLPLKMSAPEMVLCQAHGQARPVADFLHENVLDFMGEDAIEDAFVITSYLSDADFLLSTLGKMLHRNFEAENVVQSAAASIAVRGVLFGNSCPVSSRWHAIRRPKLWQVDQSLWHNKCQMASQMRGSLGSLNTSNLSLFATELKPAFTWLDSRASEGIGGNQLCTEPNPGEDETSDDEIENW